MYLRFFSSLVWLRILDNGDPPLRGTSSACIPQPLHFSDSGISGGGAPPPLYHNLLMLFFSFSFLCAWRSLFLLLWYSLVLGFSFVVYVEWDGLRVSDDGWMRMMG